MYTLIHSKLIHLFLIVCSIINTLDSSHSSSALCFLTYRPSSETVRFAFQLAQNIPSIDVFIVVDDNNVTTLPMSSSIVRFLQFNETVCTKYGFQESNMMGTGKICSAWDKALYYFSRQSTHHSFVWFIEEDVFIPSVQAFLALHELYSPSYDLVTADVEYNVTGYSNDWSHWYLAFGRFAPPWAHSMVCAIGCSRRLLVAVDEYVQWHGRLTFIEVLFHTLAIQDSKTKVVTPFELNTIVYRKRYTFEQIQARPNNWWHPIKKFRKQKQWRNRLLTNSSVTKNNNFVTFNLIEQKLNTSNGTKSRSQIKHQISNLLIEFEVVKGQLTPSSRRQLRDHFLRLALNRSDTLASTFRLLADHAFKLPQPHIDAIIEQNKTVMHVHLEKALENNKETILQLMKNDNSTANDMVTISWLRKEARRLIRELTFEMLCEQKLIACNRTEAYKFNSTSQKSSFGFDLNFEVNRYSQPRFSVKHLSAFIIVILCVILVLIKLKKRIF